MEFMDLVYIVIGYLFGSLPWALIIGKVFYNTDVREHGSGNLGGTNAGRVLGKKVGITVVVLDALKSAITVMVIAYFSFSGAVYAGLAAAIGHCYPIFAQFKGGKAIATTYGYILALAFLLNKPLLFIVPISLWVILLFSTKIMSISSMISIIFAAGFSLIYHNTLVSVCLCFAAVLAVYRHKANIKRLLNGTESKLNI